MASFPISSEMIGLFSLTALPPPFLSDSKVLYSTGMSCVLQGVSASPHIMMVLMPCAAVQKGD